jgi:hypothetical protein
MWVSETGVQALSFLGATLYHLHTRTSTTPGNGKPSCLRERVQEVESASGRACGVSEILFGPGHLGSLASSPPEPSCHHCLTFFDTGHSVPWSYSFTYFFTVCPLHPNASSMRQETLLLHSFYTQSPTHWLLPQALMKCLLDE